jgi:hypothetical protein
MLHINHMKLFLYKYYYVTSDDTPTVRYNELVQNMRFFCLCASEIKKYLSYAAHYERMLRENLF